MTVSSGVYDFWYPQFCCSQSLAGRPYNSVSTHYHKALWLLWRKNSLDGNQASFSFFSRAITTRTCSCCRFSSSRSLSITIWHRSFSFFFLLWVCRIIPKTPMLKTGNSLLHTVMQTHCNVIKTRCSQRLQTLHPVLPPVELDETCTSSLILGWYLHHIKMTSCWQSWMYTKYCIAIRRTEPRPQVTCIHSKYNKITTCGYWDMQADRQTDRQTDKLITILHTPTGGKVITVLC